MDEMSEIESADESVWLQAQDIIKKEINNDQVFNIWFSPIKFVSMTTDVICFQVPNKYFKAMLIDRYMKLLNSAIQKALGRTLKVDFVLNKFGEKDSPQKG